MRCRLCDLQDSSIDESPWLLITRLIRDGRLVQNFSLGSRPCPWNDRWIRNGRLLCDVQDSSLEASPWLLIARLVRNWRLLCDLQDSSLDATLWLLTARLVRNGLLVQNALLEPRPCPLNGMGSAKGDSYCAMFRTLVLNRRLGC